MISITSKTLYVLLALLRVQSMAMNLKPDATYFSWTLFTDTKQCVYGVFAPLYSCMMHTGGMAQVAEPTLTFN